MSSYLEERIKYFDDAYRSGNALELQEVMKEYKL